MIQFNVHDEHIIHLLLWKLAWLKTPCSIKKKNDPNVYVAKVIGYDGKRIIVETKPNKPFKLLIEEIERINIASNTRGG